MEVSRESVDTSCDAVFPMDSLILDSNQLSDIYKMMQQQCSHRLSKISLFILKIDDIRSLYDSGCKWVQKESLERIQEMGSTSMERLTKDEVIGIEMMKHQEVLGNIEIEVASVLRKRMLWMKDFVSKVESQYKLLEKFYDEISQYAIDEIGADDSEVRL